MQRHNVHVYYHSPCHDGFLAQLLIKRLLAPYANVTSSPLQHGPGRTWDLNVIHPDTDIIFVDIAPDSLFLDQLHQYGWVKSVNVWDHHIDYRNTDYGELLQWSGRHLPNFFDITLELARANDKTTLWFCNTISGSKLATLAAAWWGSRTLSEEEAADLLLKAAELYQHPIVVHASDYDTGIKEYADTDAVFAYYRNYNYEDLDRWNALLDRITAFDTPGYREIVSKGEAMLEALRSLAEKLAFGETPRPLSVSVASGTYNGVICNAYGLLANDLGDIFRKDYDFAIMYSITPTKITLSIRSVAGVPANEIAQLWGGGGHAFSAGASICGDDRIEWLKQYAFV